MISKFLVPFDWTFPAAWIGYEFSYSRRKFKLIRNNIENISLCGFDNFPNILQRFKYFWGSFWKSLPLLRSELWILKTWCHLKLQHSYLPVHGFILAIIHCESTELFNDLSMKSVDLMSVLGNLSVTLAFSR